MTTLSPLNILAFISVVVNILGCLLRNLKVPFTELLMLCVSTILDMNDTFDTGRKLDMSAESIPVFFRSGVTMACR